MNETDNPMSLVEGGEPVEKRRWSKPTVAPQVGNAEIAYRALGQTSKVALSKKFTRNKSPLPACLRFKDGEGVWIYDIERIKAYWRGEWRPEPE